MSLWRRIAVEKRSILVPLGLALIVNVGVYAFVVYPLGVRSAGAAIRAQRATANLRAAEADHAAARALVAATARADQELQTFYGKVLPSDFSAARRLTYTTIPDLARKAGIRLTERQTEVDDKDAQKTGLARLAIRVTMEGDYEKFREFLYAMESAPEFVILDDVAMDQSDPAKPLVFIVALSTYYRQGANGH